MRGLEENQENAEYQAELSNLAEPRTVFVTADAYSPDIDAALSEVIAAWPSLPEERRAEVVELVRSSLVVDGS